jgi:6-phosphogluconolactonase
MGLAGSKPRNDRSRNLPWAGPRFVGLDPAGRFLYAANEGGDAIVTFAVDAASGGLRPTGQVSKVASPVTIVFTTNP